jgi:ATP-dependent Clp protease ATP-binding subunit ClpC
MFERFTERAIKAIMLGQEESRRLGHNFVGNEQIFLGLLGEGTGIAYKSLVDAGFTLKDARIQVEHQVGRGGGLVPVEIPFTPNAKRVLERSMVIADEFKHAYIGTEHLLLSLIAEKTGVVANILLNSRINLEKFREEIIIAMGTDASEAGNILKKLPLDYDEEDRRSVLKDHTTNLSILAKNNKIDPVVGRSKEIERVVQILVRRKKNNAILIGEPGVGKTSVAEGLALRIFKRDIPKMLETKEIVALDIGSLLAGTKFRGEFEERLKNILQEVKKSGKIILVIDEVHMLIGAGASEGGMDAANILKPVLARGELQCIGATTLDEYRKHIQKDAALDRRFQPVKIPEPTVEETIQILRGLRHRYESHHSLRISDEAIVAASKLGAQFIADRFLPDKAIDLLDEGGARVRLRDSTLPAHLKQLENEISVLSREKTEAIIRQDFLEANRYFECEEQARNQLIAFMRILAANFNPVLADLTVDYEVIAEIVSSWTGIPVNKLSKSETEKLVNMEELLHKKVIGQEVAVSAISRSIRRARVGLKNPNRPIASFIFAGPTGVGKTELTKALAGFFFGSETSMVRLDMSEYMERHNMSKLIGSPPGYVGFSDGGLLSEQVRRKPYTVVLFDEIEKAHPDIFNLLLQVLDEGRLTDSQGRLIDFKNTLIILTSNLGSKLIEKEAEDLEKKGPLGDDPISLEMRRTSYERIVKSVNDELKNHFRPEFLNRLDDIIVFQRLTQQDVRKIADLMIADVVKRVAEQGYNLTVQTPVIDKLAKDGFNPVYGARPLRRAIMSGLEDPLANLFLQESPLKHSDVLIDLDKTGNLSINITGITAPKIEETGVREADIIAKKYQLKKDKIVIPYVDIMKFKEKKSFQESQVELQEHLDKTLGKMENLSSTDKDNQIKYEKMKFRAAKKTEEFVKAKNLYLASLVDKDSKTKPTKKDEDNNDV